MKKSKFILPFFGISTLSMIAIPLVSCNKTVDYTITFNDGDHGIVTSPTVIISGKQKWGDIQKPTINVNWGYAPDGWKNQDGKDMTDDMVIDSNITVTAKYKTIDPKDQITKEADATTQIQYGNCHFYTPTDYYKNKQLTLLQHKAYTQYTFNIDASKISDGIQYFWIAKSETKYAQFGNDFFIGSIKFNGATTFDYEVKEWDGEPNIYIDLLKPYKEGTLTIEIKFSKDVTGIPCFEILEAW